MMGVIKVEVELSAEQEKLFEAYLEDRCLDRDKWIKRMVYMGISSAVGKYRQPVGRLADAFSRQKESVKARKKK
ncbi:MAG: hypothetical protein LBJ90_06475 [Treponema sp.]|jgi:hypothetical protein|nr:hypothetical protein [Treponema sp.]